jgi:hypothetical protein
MVAVGDADSSATKDMQAAWEELVDSGCAEQVADCDAACPPAMGVCLQDSCN